MTDKKNLADEELQEKKLQEKIKDLETELLETKNLLKESSEKQMRFLADLENFRRRETENKKDWSDLAVIDFLKKFLPNFLELEKGKEHCVDENITKVLEKFIKNLEDLGIKKIIAKKGENLDPEIHEVVMTENGKTDTIVQTLEVGWKFREKIIIPAKVSVGKS